MVEEDKILEKLEELRKKKKQQRASETRRGLSPGGKVLWEAKEMELPEFLDYVQRLRNSPNTRSRERAEKLVKEYTRWNKEYSDEEAIKKAFASVQVKESNEKIKELRTRGASEEEIQEWENVKGHALTQHQKPERFWQRLGTPLEQPPPRPPPVIPPTPPPIPSPVPPPRPPPVIPPPTPPTPVIPPTPPPVPIPPPIPPGPTESICAPFESYMKWFVRQMAETNFDLSWRSFLQSGKVQGWLKDAELGYMKIGTKKVKEEELTAILKRCYWLYYREFYEEEIKLGGAKTTYKGKSTKMYHFSLPRQAYRKTLGWAVPKRGLFDTDEGGTPHAKTFGGNPLMRSAINKGRGILRKSAVDYYNYIRKNAEPKLNDLDKKIKDIEKKLKDARDAYEKKMNEAYKHANSVRSKAGVSALGSLPTGGDMDKMMGAVMSTLAASAKDKTADILLKDIENTYKDWEAAKKEYDGLSEQMEKIIDEFDPKNFYNTLRDKLNKDVEGLAQKLGASIGTKMLDTNKLPTGGTEYWKYKDLAQQTILEELQREADYLARFYAKRMQSRWMKYTPRLALGLRSISTKTQTVGESWTLLLHNIWNFVFGPWTLATLFALLQFFFVLTYVGYNIQILWIFPTIAAIFTWILNLSESTRPFDWITHLSSGAIIGYSSALLLVALGAPGWGFIGGSNTIGFWIAWGILGFIGLFQFYQTDGFKVVLQVGVLVLLLSYLAMGPYQAYFHSAIGQVKAPVEIAYRSVSSAITDVWLLATNPTEWYARQQLVNVKAERPLDLPKGVEITSLEALPPSVPAGQQFALATVIRNDGILPASDIILSVGCNQWCNSLSAAPTTTKSYEDAKSRLGPGTVQSLDSGSVFYIDDKMERKEGQTITFTPLVAKVFAQSVAQTNIAKITFNLSYAYSTKSSLQVDVINENELERRFREGDTVFKPVVAVDKGTPARLSLNVGPQPLRANTNETILLISISNTRDNSKIVLPRGTNVTIKLPKAVGHDLYCGPSQTVTEDENYTVVDYRIEPTSLTQDTIEVLPYDFNSIFAFICKFTTKDVDTLKSGFITAELPRYIFRIEQKKDVFITPALGIIYEPFEEECNKCGQGATNLCNNPNECHNLSDQSARGDPARTCYYEHAGEDPVLGFSFTQVFGGKFCKVCGSTANNCEKFISKETCENEDSVCGWNCVWNEGKKHLVSTVEIGGTCEKAEVPRGGTGTDCTNYGICPGISGNNTDYNVKSLIKTAADQTTADPYAIGAIMHQESGCGHYLSNGHVKCSESRAIGLMQLIPSTAQSELGNSNLACDPQQNVVGGAKYILRMRDRYLPYKNSKSLTDDEVWQLAFAAYNTGPGNVDSAISRAGSYHWSAVRSRVAAQTQTYVDNVFPAFNSPTSSNNCYA